MAEPQKAAPKSDPWADDPSMAQQPAGSGSAPAKDDDWKVWQQQPEEAQQGNPLQRAFDSATARKDHSADQGVMGNIGTGIRNMATGVLGMAAPLVHPIKTLESMSVPMSEANDLMSGKPGALHNAMQNDPLVNTGKSFAEHPLESAEQMGGAALAGKVGASAVGGMAKMIDPIRAYRSPLIPENEAIARAATDVIKPNPLEYRKTVSNLQANLPNIKEHLNTAGVPNPSSPLEFAKGASGGGQNFSDFYKEHLIAPNADAPVGSGTVSSTYGRLSDINDKLRPIYRARSMGEQMTKESADQMAALEQERDQLNGNLYKTLSDRTGLPVEQIQGINQRGAQMQSVGDVTDSAQSLRRSGFGGFTPQGVPIPLGPLDKAMKLVDYVRGGSEAVAGRKLARILNQVKDEPTALPNADELANHRANYQAQENDAAESNRLANVMRKPPGLAPTDKSEFLKPVAMTDDSELFNRAQRGQQRGETIANRGAAARMDTFLDNERQAELLAKARRGQKVARTYRNKEQ